MNLKNNEGGMIMETSQRGIDFIKSFETLQLKAYKAVPTERYYTIGYGHYGADVRPDMEISVVMADALLKEDLAVFEEGVNTLTAGLVLRQCQFDALVSFAYNCGCDALAGSTLLKKIRSGASEQEIRHEFSRWDKSGGQVLSGLARRRKAEADMYFGQH